MGAVSQGSAARAWSSGSAEREISTRLAVTGEHLATLMVRADETVGDLKRKLAAQGVDGGQGGAFAIRLLFGGRELMNAESLDRAGVRDKDTLDVVRMNSLPVITASSDNTAKIWNSENGDCLLTLVGHKSEVKTASFSFDGKQVLTCSRDDARIWDATTGKCVRLIKKGGHRDMWRGAAFSPDSKLLATISDDGTSIIWTADTGACLSKILPSRRELWSAEFSPCGEFLLIAGVDRTAKIYRLQDYQCVCSFDGHGGEVRQAVWSNSGEWVVTGSSDCTAKLWRASDGQCVQTYGRDSVFEVWGVAISSDDKLVATACLDCSAKLWDRASGQCMQVLSGHTGPVVSVSFAPGDGTLVTAANDDTAKVWCMDTFTCTQTLVGHKQSLWSARFMPKSDRSNG